MSTESDRASTHRLDTDDPKTETTGSEWSRHDAEESATRPGAAAKREDDGVFVAGADSVSAPSSDTTDDGGNHTAATPGEPSDSASETPGNPSGATAHDGGPSPAATGEAYHKAEVADGGATSAATGAAYDDADAGAGSADETSNLVPGNSGDPSDATARDGEDTAIAAARSEAETDDSGTAVEPGHHRGPDTVGTAAESPDEPGVTPDHGATSDPAAVSSRPESGEVPAHGTEAAESAAAAAAPPSSGEPPTELIPALRQPVQDVATAPLFDEHALGSLRDRWHELQGAFVDDPRDAVTRADDLVAELIHQLTAAYAERKDALAEGWPEGSDTEALRHALRGYRAFFNQLLSPTG